MTMKTGEIKKVSMLQVHKDKNHILLVLWQNGQMTIDEISEATGLHRNDVVAELETLDKYGRAAQVGTKLCKGQVTPTYQILNNGENVLRKHINEIVRIINREKRNKVIVNCEPATADKL